MTTRIQEFDDELTDEQWEEFKRELAEYGCFYDDEDELMKNLRIRRAQANRERFLSGDRTVTDRPAAAREESRVAG